MKNLMIIIGLSFLISSCEIYEAPAPQTTIVQAPQGNANVKSWFFTVPQNGWTISGLPGDNNHSLFTVLSIPNLDAGYVNEGLVLVYLDYGNATFSPLPITVASGSTDTWLNNYVSLGQVEVNIQLANLQTPIITGNYYFKVVAVDGFSRKMNPDLNWNNYKDVAARFSLD
jgi:hypothetical protein